MQLQPLLVVLAGRPGTGKTTLARRLATEAHAAHVRSDAIATAIMRYGLTKEPSTAGQLAYIVAHEIVAETLRAGAPAVVDAVNAVHELRAGWVELARRLDARLIVLETSLDDAEEHRRRVEERHPDLVSQVVPSWTHVLAQRYDAWDVSQDGPRHAIEMSDTELGVAAALRHLTNVRKHDEHATFGSLSVRVLEPRDDDWVKSAMEEDWGSVLVARKGELLDASRFPGFVAVADGVRVGLAIVVVGGDEYEVLSFSAAIHGRGVGRALLQQCFDDARSRGCRRVWLTTTNNNVPALGFYQRMGMNLCGFYRDAVSTARHLKPSIPLFDGDGVPIAHELEFELLLTRD